MSTDMMIHHPQLKTLIPASECVLAAASGNTSSLQDVSEENQQNLMEVLALLASAEEVSLDVRLTESEMDQIIENFDARGNDFTKLFPIVEKIIRDRLAGETEGL